MHKDILLRFTPSELAEMLIMPSKYQVVGVRTVEWCEQWQVIGRHIPGKLGTIPQFPQQCLTEESYAKAFREYAIKQLAAQEDHSLEVPIKPQYTPCHIEIAVMDTIRGQGKNDEPA